MESTLQQNSNYPGFRLTPNEPAFTHFQTHDIDPATIESNRIATYVNTALTALKGKFNLTKTQFKSCLKRQNISTSAFCVPKKANCIPEQTRYLSVCILNHKILMTLEMSRAVIIEPMRSATTLQTLCMVPKQRRSFASSQTVLLMAFRPLPLIAVSNRHELTRYQRTM